MRKHSTEEKIQVCEAYISGNKSVGQICKEFGLSDGNAPGCFWNWVYRYKKFGKDAFSDGRKRKRYSPELKKEVVKAYMNGEGSFLQLALKYGISTDDMVRKWYKLYKDEIAGTAQE